MKKNQFFILLLASIFSIYLGIELYEIFEQKKIEELVLSDTPRQSILGNPKKVIKKKKQEITLADRSFRNKWGLNLTDSYKAWKNHPVRGKDIVVAVIDTGIDTKHPEFKNRLWLNKGETGLDHLNRDKRTNGIDDDQNGYIDDVHGWNFIQSNADISDDHGHGTHISGIIAASGIQVAGVAPQAKLMILKYYDASGGGKDALKNTIKSIKYATQMGASIINYSGGGVSPNALEKKAIYEALKKDILFVAAAGNEYSNSDVSGYFPANYPLENIISVTAIDQSKQVLRSSNYGVSNVDIAAPGKKIYSSLPSSSYGYLTGTSQATGFVTGVAALLRSRFKDLSSEKIIEHITRTGDYYSHLDGKTGFSKKLNTYRALSILSKDMGISGGLILNSKKLDSFTPGGVDVKKEKNTLLESLESIRKINNK